MGTYRGITYVFRNDLREELGKIKLTYLNYGSLETIFDKVLDKHARIKKKYVWANGKPFMTRALNKAVMLNFRLRTKITNKMLVPFIFIKLLLMLLTNKSGIQMLTKLKFTQSLPPKILSQISNKESK